MCKSTQHSASSMPAHTSSTSELRARPSVAGADIGESKSDWHLAAPLHRKDAIVVHEDRRVRGRSVSDTAHCFAARAWAPRRQGGALARDDAIHRVRRAAECGRAVQARMWAGYASAGSSWRRSCATCGSSAPTCRYSWQRSAPPPPPATPLSTTLRRVWRRSTRPARRCSPAALAQR